MPLKLMGMGGKSVGGSEVQVRSEQTRRRMGPRARAPSENFGANEKGINRCLNHTL